MMVPRRLARACELKETAISKSFVGFVAVKGSNIKSHAERRAVSYTDGCEGISVKMQCADAQKVCASRRKMNMGGDVVLLAGGKSYMQNKSSWRETRVGHECGQYVMYMWLPVTKADFNW